MFDGGPSANGTKTASPAGGGAGRAQGGGGRVWVAELSLGNGHFRAPASFVAGGAQPKT